MTPEFHPLAQPELNDAAGFYEASAVGLGGDFLNEMERPIALVCIFPDVGREHPAAIRTLAARRFPYTLVYRCSANGFSFLPLRISVASRDTGRGELAQGRHNNVRIPAARNCGTIWC